MCTHSSPVTVSLGTVVYRPSMEFVEPAYIVCRGTDRYRREPCLPVGEVGGAVLMTTNYVGPMHVSFEGIMLAEIPCSDVIPPEGYYATTNYTDSFSHTKTAGAGWTRRVSPGNYWTVDMAGTYSSYANWSPGRMEWKIPIGWFRFFEGNPVESRIEIPDREDRRDVESRLLLIGDSGTYRQTFTIGGDGTFKIEKHGHWLSRSTNCVITLDGRVIQERHP